LIFLTELLRFFVDIFREYDIEEAATTQKKAANDEKKA
jgi:hypothetical protein